LAPGNLKKPYFIDLSSIRIAAATSFLSIRMTASIPEESDSTLELYEGEEYDLLIEPFAVPHLNHPVTLEVFQVNGQMTDEPASAVPDESSLVYPTATVVTQVSATEALKTGQSMTVRVKHQRECTKVVGTIKWNQVEEVITYTVALKTVTIDTSPISFSTTHSPITVTKLAGWNHSSSVLIKDTLVMPPGFTLDLVDDKNVHWNRDGRGGTCPLPVQ
jgi:hypothetical protein